MPSYSYGPPPPSSLPGAIPAPAPWTPPQFPGIPSTPGAPQVPGVAPTTPRPGGPSIWQTNTGPAIIGGVAAGGSAIAQWLANRAQQRESQQFTAEQNQQRMLADLFGAQMAAQQDQAALDQRRQETGLQATQADPLTQQRSRANFALTRALIGGARNVDVQAPAGMRGFQPQISGGMRIPEGGFGPDVMNYLSEDAQLAADANFGQNAAPFMRPPNYAAVGYGNRAAPSTPDPAQSALSGAFQSTGLADPSANIDATAGGSGGGATGSTGNSGTGSVPGSTSPTSVSGDINDILAPYSRRGATSPAGVPTSTAGGFLQGSAQGASTGFMIGGPIGAGIGAAIGSVVGSIWGAINHTASTAPTDLAINDARQAITMAYQQFLGRQPSAEELNGIVQGQGWQPGDRWMGASSINYVLNQIGQSDEAQARRQQAQAPTGQASTSGAAAPNPQTSGRNYMSRTAGDEAQSAHDLYIQYLRQQQGNRNQQQQQFEQQRQWLLSTYGGSQPSSSQSSRSGGSRAGQIAGQAAAWAPTALSIMQYLRR